MVGVNTETGNSEAVLCRWVIKKKGSDSVLPAYSLLLLQNFFEK